MNRFLDRLGINRQITLVGMLGVVGLIIVGIVYYIGNAEQSGAQQRLGRATQSLDTLNAVKIDLLEARRSEKDFLLRRKDDYVQKHDVAVAAASRDLVVLRALV